MITRLLLPSNQLRWQPEEQQFVGHVLDKLISRGLWRVGVRVSRVSD